MSGVEQTTEKDQIEHYAQGLDIAADVAHAEARWQAELAMRASDDRLRREMHEYAAERASRVEAAIRGVAACSRPPADRECAPCSCDKDDETHCTCSDVHYPPGQAADS